MPTRIEDIPQTFGSAIREARQEKGITQEGLALAAGLDRSFVGQVERAERNITLKNVVCIARALGMTGADLMARADM